MRQHRLMQLLPSQAACSPDAAMAAVRAEHCAARSHMQHSFKPTVVHLIVASAHTGPAD